MTATTVMAFLAFFATSVMAIGTWTGAAPLPPRWLVGTLWALLALANGMAFLEAVS